jgi:hypothetical protein
MARPFARAVEALAALGAIASMQWGCLQETIEVNTTQPSGQRIPVETQPVDPSLDVGTTAFFEPGSGSQSLARLRFAKPRAVTLYVLWDPYKNNPQAVPSDQFQTAGFPLGVNRQVFGALGRIKIGLQQAVNELNFEIPYGQQIAVPVVCDYCELSAKIIRPVFGRGNPPLLSPTVQAFNDPDQFPILPGDTFPNVATKYPRGFVAITGFLGDGSIGAKAAVGGPGFIRSAFIGGLAAADTRYVPIAFGATHFEIRATNALVAGSCWVDLFGGGGPWLFPNATNNDTPARLPLYAQVIQVTNAAATPQSVEVIQYIGF